MLHARTFSAAIALWVASAPAGAGVLTVDTVAGPGVDFTDIQAAVNAALEGDTIIVRQGVYPGFTIFGKSLSVLADLGDDITCDTRLNVRNLAPGQSVTLRGFDVFLPDQEGLAIQDCLGLVWVEDCEFRGAVGAGLFAEPGGPDGSPGARVDDSFATFQSCTFVGGRGSDLVLFLGLQGSGGSALRIENGSSVSLYDCVLTAGDGGDVNTDEAAEDGGDGGSGIFFQSGTLMLSNCEVTAGDGGIGGEDPDDPGGPLCGVGGDGGDGLEHAAVLSGPADAFGLDATITPGAAGAGFGLCPGGAPGSVLQLPNGTYTDFGGGSLQLDVTSPVRSGEFVDFDLVGPPDSLVAIALHMERTFLLITDVLGVLHLELDGIVTLSLGAFPASGELNFTVPQSIPLDPGEALQFLVQSFYSSPATGAVLGASAELTVLHQAL